MIIGQPGSDPVSQRNIVVTTAIIESQPDFLNSTTNSLYLPKHKGSDNPRIETNRDCDTKTKQHFGEKETVSQDVSYCEIYSCVQRPKKKMDSNWYKSLDNIEVVKSNSDENIVSHDHDDGFYDLKEDSPHIVSIRIKYWTKIIINCQ